MRHSLPCMLAAVLLLTACQVDRGAAGSQADRADDPVANLAADRAADGPAASGPPAPPESNVAEPLDESLREGLEDLFGNEQTLGELLSEPFPMGLPNVRPLPESPPRAESWVNCEGYLTRDADEGFCADTPPDDWTPFEFEGQRYFLVPLG